MNLQETVKRFEDQLKDKQKPTAQDFRDAAASIGEDAFIPPMPDIIIGKAESYNINPEKELSELHAAQSKAKAAAAERKRRANLKARAGEISKLVANLAETAETADPDTLTDTLSAISKEAAGLITTNTTVNRFSTWTDYFSKCKTYDPAKDFTPSMFAGLRFPNGTISYIGARPGGGKSTMLINLAREALDAGRNVFLVNLEMVNRAIITNHILASMYATANEAQRKELNKVNKPMIRFYSLFKNQYDDRETFDHLRKQAIEKTETILNKRLFIYDGASEDYLKTISAIESRIQTGDVVLIDYIQRMNPPKGSGESRYIQIKLASNGLLSLALRKNIVIISGAQCGRQAKENKGREATMDDFRESGDIEQDAHNALVIETIGEPKDGKRYVHILKEREGGSQFPRATLECNFNYLYIKGTGKKYEEDKDEPTPTPGNGNEETKTWKEIAKEELAKTAKARSKK